MSRKFARLAAATFLAVLAGCSSGRRSAEFTLDGVREAPKNCALDPQSFAQAEPVDDFRQSNGCGVSNAYKVYGMDGITFSQSALINCNVANSMHGWVQRTVQPAAQRHYGASIVGMKIAASYACRPRNNVRGAKLSEHGQGNAIDIAAFTLSDGREINVERDYYGSAFLRTVRSEACGTFNTVLGPGSDYDHRNHFHLDMQRMRSGGAYCH